MRKVGPIKEYGVQEGVYADKSQLSRSRGSPLDGTIRNHHLDHDIDQEEHKKDPVLSIGGSRPKAEGDSKSPASGTDAVGNAQEATGSKLAIHGAAEFNFQSGFPGQIGGIFMGGLGTGKHALTGYLGAGIL